MTAMIGTGGNLAGGSGELGVRGGGAPEVGDGVPGRWGGWTTLTPGGVSANEGAKARMVSGEEIGGIMEARGEGGSYSQVDK